jgi:hypothetical protein
MFSITISKEFSVVWDNVVFTKTTINLDFESFEQLVFKQL